LETVVKGQFETIAFAYMNIGATHMLELAESSDDGQLYNLISCITFSAFTLEAYFNHLGSHLHDDWQSKELKLSKLQKYKSFCKDLKIDIDFSKRPYSTITKMFSYRDTMAHGKTTCDQVNKNIAIEIDNPTNFSAGAPWLEFSTIENSKMVLNDMQQVVKELHLAAGFKGDPFISTGSGLFAIQI
jgi:hypothetical protein